MLISIQLIWFNKRLFEMATSSISILMYCTFIMTLIITWFATYSGKIDYFNERYSEDKNCKNKAKLKKLITYNHDLCIKYAEQRTNPDQWLQTCTLQLAKKLSMECSSKRFELSGNLAYCNERGMSICCVTSYACKPYDTYDWTYRGKEYLNNTTKYLKEHLVRGMGYKSCHHLEDYDASACAIDCKKYAKSKFAKECKEESGLFKCCIRRDAYCDKCKFCCTLPMCTYKDNTTTYDSTPLASEKVTASDIFAVPRNIYKMYDYRCLKPNSHKDPNKWRHYDTKEFRAANNKSQLSNVYSYSFNKNMFNYFDQSILNKYTSKNGKRLLQKTYGFDYCSGDNKIKAFPIVGGVNTDCTLQCERMESDEFANNCRKQKGVFKCCQVWNTLHRYSEVNINLGLTKGTHCKKKNLYKYCDYCCITLMCTKKDKKSGKIVNKLKTKISRAQKVGGYPSVGYGMKMFACLEMDMCKSIRTWLWYKSTSEYKNVYKPEEICRLKVDDYYGTRETRLIISFQRKKIPPLHLRNHVPRKLLQSCLSLCKSPNISLLDLSDKKTNKCLNNKKSAEINVKICSTKILRKKGEAEILIRINKQLAKMRSYRQKNCKENKCKKMKKKKKKLHQRKEKRKRRKKKSYKRKGKRKTKKDKVYKSNGMIKRKRQILKKRIRKKYKSSIEDLYTAVRL